MSRDFFSFLLRGNISPTNSLQQVVRKNSSYHALPKPESTIGTPAAPQPMASRLRFYEDDELRRLAEVAGFDRANVVRRDLEPFARQVGVPPDHLSLFAGPGEPFLLAQKG